MPYTRLGIFIPCYNASSTIAATLLSVQKAIINASQEIPVFVYDDCSTDDSADVARNAWNSAGKCSVIKNQQNFGERKTTNLAFSSFRNSFDWIFIIHADDIVKEDWLTTLIGYIMHADAGKYFTIWSSYDSFNDHTGKVIKGDDTGNVQQGTRSYDTIKYFLTQVYCSWHISGAAVNVALYNQLNGFDEQMAQFGDTDFFVRGLLAGFMDMYVSRTLTLYRISAGSVSSVSLRTNRDVNEIFYLINKFRNILSAGEVSSMYRIISRLCVRRVIKSLRTGNFTMAVLNIKQLGKSFFR